MKVKDILSFLSCRFPLETACDFDNVGLLVGNGESEVKNVLICLDCTAETVIEAEGKGCNLIVTHHPVIFEGVKNILADSVPYTCVEKGISVISMHTNLDIAKGGVSETLCKVLGLSDIVPFEAEDGFVLWQGKADNITAPCFAGLIKEKLGGVARYTDNKKPISRVLVCSGSGGEFVFCAAYNGFDAFVSAEIKHHQLLAANDLSLCAFDAGHFNSEDIIVEPLKELLQKEFADTVFYTFHSNAIKTL